MTTSGTVSTTQFNTEAVTRRFLAHVEKTPTCWLWKGGRREGYGAFGLKYGNKWLQYGAHRISWQLFYGSIPFGVQVLHVCDVRHCVNPEHLFLGTAQDNTNDMVKKGRDLKARGSQQGNAVLVEEEVIEIRRLYKASGLTQEAIGRHFRVSQQRVSAIVRLEDWKHVV